MQHGANTGFVSYGAKFYAAVVIIPLTYIKLGSAA